MDKNKTNSHTSVRFWIHTGVSEEDKEISCSFMFIWTYSIHLFIQNNCLVTVVEVRLETFLYFGNKTREICYTVHSNNCMRWTMNSSGPLGSSLGVSRKLFYRYLEYQNRYSVCINLHLHLYHLFWSLQCHHLLSRAQRYLRDLQLTANVCVSICLWCME